MYYLYIEDKKQRVIITTKPLPAKKPAAIYRTWKLAKAAATHIADKKDYILEWDYERPATHKKQQHKPPA